ncbi:MAG: hypothetical protein JWO03_172, partial [Bacteroidetes bacterium]|nr:hypothetical protein [Bacteroidota bacterium]
MSQELVGKVTDSDSAATALYQAEVTQSQGGKVIATYKTYFDGSYHLKVKPNQAYQIKATYGGRRDSTVTISVDKNGMLISGTLVLSLYKNGLRLMGYVLDREEDLPIKEAGILIRNVMTRKEDKYFTDVNGYYNLKMDFETNYTFKIDKRSPGIINKYQDTSFNISTIGFNQPLDFRFDIKLGPAEGFTKARPQYDPYAAPDNKNLKPVVQVVGKKDSLKQHDKETALAELDKKLNSKDSAIASINKKLEDINQAKKEEKTALNTDDQGKKKEDDAKLKAEHDKQAEAKRKELEKAEAAIKAKQLAENNQKEKEAADKLRKEQEDAALAKLEKERKEKLTAEKTQKGKEATDKLRKEQEDAAVAKLEKERIEKLTTEKTQKAKEAADKLRKEQEDAAGAKLEKERIEKLTAEKTQKEKEAADKLRKEQEDAAVAKLEKERK